MGERYSQSERNVYGAEGDDEMDAILSAVAAKLAEMPEGQRRVYEG